VRLTIVCATAGPRGARATL